MEFPMQQTQHTNDSCAEVVTKACIHTQELKPLILNCNYMKC